MFASVCVRAGICTCSCASRGDQLHFGLEGGLLARSQCDNNATRSRVHGTLVARHTNLPDPAQRRGDRNYRRPVLNAVDALRGAMRLRYGARWRVRQVATQRTLRSLEGLQRRDMIGRMANE